MSAHYQLDYRDFKNPKIYWIRYIVVIVVKACLSTATIYYVLFCSPKILYCMSMTMTNAILTV